MDRPAASKPRTHRWSWVALGLVCGMVLLAAATVVWGDEAPFPRPEGWPDPARVGEARADPEPDAAGGPKTEDGPLDPFFDLIDPARFQRIVDGALARGFGERPTRERPAVPELGEPVFFDQVRPLGSKKYSNELNYLLNPSTGNAPTLQVIEYEYAFADWKAVELDLSYFNGSLEILTPFYQRTLGVGRGGRSVHGVQVSPDIYLRSGFLGGSAVYMYGWKPTRESRFSTLTFLGANRQLIGGFAFPAVPGSRLGTLAGTSPQAAHPGDDKVYGSWRPTFNINLFYKLNEKFALGIENDLFCQAGRAGEYFVFPFLTWEAGQHAFFQVGGGYYHFESRDQFTFLLHLNFVNPSVRVTDEQEQEGAAPPAGEAESSPGTPTRQGPIRRWLSRRGGS